MKHQGPMHGQSVERKCKRASASVLLAIALSGTGAVAAENAAPVLPPPKAAAATGPSPKAVDAPKGTKAGATPAAAPSRAAPAAAPSSGVPAPRPDVPPAKPAEPAQGAEGTAPVPPPPAAPPRVEGGPPPLYYVEPEGGGAAPPPPPPLVQEPPPPTFIYEPPLPPEPRRLVPETAFWAGARLSWFVPFGSLWVDSFDSRAGRYYRRRTFDDYASSGPGLELDIGARLARRYNVFAIMEHAFLGTGSLDTDARGGQTRGRTSFYGAGLRFSSDPTAIGFLLEIALGYREFRASWNDGTELSLTGGWLDARVGLGADIRVNKYFALSPMITFGGGTFGRARWSGPIGNRDALTGVDDLGEYGTFSVQLGGHFDIY